MTYTNHLSELLPIISIKIIPHLSDIIKHLSQDSDEIKLALLSQIPIIIKFIQSFDDGYELIREIITNHIFQLLGYHNFIVKEAAGSKICEAAALLSEDDQRNIILTKIL